MIFSFAEYARIEEEQFNLMSQEEKYRYILLTQIGNPYRWGKENAEYSDCSGAVCFSLMAAGWDIRTTANGLMNKIFTEHVNGIDAIFYVTTKQVKHGNRIVPAGTATHVIGIVDTGVVLNMTPPVAKLESEISALNWAVAHGYTTIIRGASREKLNMHHFKKDLFSGIDMELSKVFY